LAFDCGANDSQECAVATSAEGDRNQSTAAEVAKTGRVAVFLDRIVKVMAAQLRKKRERSGKVCSQARAPRHALKRWLPAGCR
jgi:hypothetical protein